MSKYSEIQRVKGFVLTELIDLSHAGADDVNNESLSSDEDVCVACVMVSNKLGPKDGGGKDRNCIPIFLFCLV